MLALLLALACDTERPPRPQGLGDLCSLEGEDCPAGLVCTLIDNSYTADCPYKGQLATFRCALPCESDGECPALNCLCDNCVLDDIDKDDALVAMATCDMVDATGGGGVGSYCQMGCVEYDTATCPEIPE